MTTQLDDENAVPASSPERVAHTIARGIVARRWLPGQRLVETDLMDELEVGRSTVREGLKLLAASGVVDLIPFRGALIRTITQSDARALLPVMATLAGLGARLAAERIDLHDHRARFEAVAGEVTDPSGPAGAQRVLGSRAKFYRVLMEIAGNDELARAMPNGRAILYRSQVQAFVTADDVRAMVREYRAVAQAVLAGDPRRAETRMREHIERRGERTLPLLPPG